MIMLMWAQTAWSGPLTGVYASCELLLNEKFYEVNVRYLSMFKKRKIKATKDKARDHIRCRQMAREMAAGLKISDMS